MRERRNHPSSNKRRMNVTGRVPSNVVQYPGNRAGTGRTGGPTRYKASRKAAPSKVTPLYIWGDFDIPFLLLTLALLGFGLVMLFSASYARAYYYKDSSFYYIRRQIMWSIIGVVGMIAASFVNYHWLRKFVCVWRVTCLRRKTVRTVGCASVRSTFSRRRLPNLH